MKLLLDENLSPRLVALLADEYPESAHLRDRGLRGADDRRRVGLELRDDVLLTDRFRKSL